MNPARPLTDPTELARRIVRAVDRAWTSDHGGSDLDVAVSVIAALSLLEPADPTTVNPARSLARLSPDELTHLVDQAWAVFARMRPDLAPRLGPLRAWLNHEPSDSTRRAAHAVADAAISAGLLDLTTIAEYRQSVDLLGLLLTTLRGPKAAKTTKAYYTPAGVADLMAALVGPRPGHRILDSCAGTGGLLRAAAESMRATGHDPTEAIWVANDIDPLAAACCAVNTHLWGLGLHVLVGCGDGLGDDWIRVAEQERADAIAAWNAARGET